MDFVETMAYAGRQTWHGKGVKLNGDQPSEIMLKEAGLDWEVELVPAWYPIDPSKAAVEEDVERMEFPDGTVWERIGSQCAVRRKDTGRVVGFTHDQERSFTVSEGFNPHQNASMFAFGDALRAAGKCMWHTAGSLKGGRRVWALARTEGQFEIRRRDGSHQNIDPYLLIANGHDGGFSLLIQFTDVYVECWNTLSWAIGKNEGAFYKIRHTSGLGERVDQAREALGLAMEHHQANAEFSQALADTPMTRESFTEFAAMMLTDLNDAEKAIETVAKSEGRQRTLYDARGEVMTRLFQGGAGSMGGVDKLDALNAITEWIDHYRGRDEHALAEMDREAHLQATRKDREALIEQTVGSMKDARKSILNAEQQRADRKSDGALHSAWFGDGAKKKRRAAKLLATRW